MKLIYTCVFITLRSMCAFFHESVSSPWVTNLTFPCWIFTASKLNCFDTREILVSPLKVNIYIYVHIIARNQEKLYLTHVWSSLLIPADGREGLFWEAAMWWTLSTVFSPASLLFRQAKLFYAAVDVNSLLRCLCLLFTRNSKAWIISCRDLKALTESVWNMDKEMNSRREERVKLVIFLAHGCSYTRCIPEAFLWILCRSACCSWEKGRKREEKSL